MHHDLGDGHNVGHVLAVTGSRAVNRAFLLILVPAIAVGLGYLFVMRRLGYALEPFRFVAAAVGVVAAVWLVQRHQKRKALRRSR